MKALKVLLTGAHSPFAGALLPGLAARCQVRQTDYDFAAGDEVDYMRADLTNPGQVTAILHGLDAVVHTTRPPASASHAAAGMQAKDAAATALLGVSVLGTRNLLELGSRLGLRHFVIITSASAVGDGLLGCSHRCAELLVAFYRREHGLAVSLLQPPPTPNCDRLVAQIIVACGGEASTISTATLASQAPPT